MASQSIISVLADWTIADELNNENNNHIANSNRVNPPLSQVLHGYNSSPKLTETFDENHEPIGNGKTGSYFNAKKKLTAAQKKSILTSTENISSITVNETTATQPSQVWQYAIRCPDSKYSICCLCPDSKKISTNNGSTSTLRKHLVSKHQLHDLALPASKRQRVESSISTEKKEHLHSLFVKCIVRDGRTFNDFQKPGMKKLLEEITPGYQPPTRYAVARRLKHLHVYHYKKLITDLSSIKHLSITLDFWSNRQMRSFLVITGHYFGVDGFNLQSTILNFSAFDYRHKSVEISRILKAKLIELNILHKVVRVTCDGGRNLVCAISDVDLNWKRLWCVAHRLHLCITIAFGFWIVKKKEAGNNGLIEEKEDMNIGPNDRDKEMATVDQLESDDEIDEVDEMSMDVMDDLELDYDESLQSDDWTNEQEELLYASLDDEITDNWTVDVIESDINIVCDQEMIISLMKKCRGFVSMIKRSTIITLFFDAERKKANKKRNLCYDVKSRWNSTYCMIDSFVVLREVIEKLFIYKHHLQIRPKQLKKLSGFELTSDEWIILATLHSILQPFFRATKAMSASQYPSIGLAFYLLTRLKNFLQHHDKKDTSLQKRLKQLLLAQFVHYFESDNEQTQLLKLHAYFDPSGFATLTDIEKRSIEQTIKRMVIEEPSFSVPPVTDTSSISASATNSSDKSNLYQNTKKSAMDLFNESVGEFLHEENRRDGNKKATIVEELHNYRKFMVQFNSKRKLDVSSCLLFWRTYGHTFSILNQVAKQMLSTPATSVPSESCFSTSSFLGRKERIRLTGENLSSSIFLKDKIKF